MRAIGAVGAHHEHAGRRVHRGDDLQVGRRPADAAQHLVHHLALHQRDVEALVLQHRHVLRAALGVDGLDGEARVGLLHGGDERRPIDRKAAAGGGRAEPQLGAFLGRAWCGHESSERRGCEGRGRAAGARGSETWQARAWQLPGQPRSGSPCADAGFCDRLLWAPMVEERARWRHARRSVADSNIPAAAAGFVAPEADHSCSARWLRLHAFLQGQHVAGEVERAADQDAQRLGLEPSAGGGWRPRRRARRRRRGPTAAASGERGRIVRWPRGRRGSAR